MNLPNKEHVNLQVVVMRVIKSEVTVVVGNEDREDECSELVVGNVTQLALVLLRCLDASSQGSSFWNESMCHSAYSLLSQDTISMMETVKSKCRAMSTNDLSERLKQKCEDLSQVTVKFTTTAVCYLHERELLCTLVDLGVIICSVGIVVTVPSLVNTPLCRGKLDMCAVQVMLCSMQLLVNTRDDIAAGTAMLLDDHTAFTQLRKLAKQEATPLYQLACSYVIRKRLGGKGYKDLCPTLDQYRPVIETFVSCLQQAQDAIEEVVDPKQCIVRMLGIMSKRLRESRTSNSLNFSVNSAVTHITKSIDNSIKLADVFKSNKESSSLIGARCLRVVQCVVDTHFVSPSFFTGSYLSNMTPKAPLSAAVPTLPQFFMTPVEEVVEEKKVIESNTTPVRPSEVVAPLTTTSFINLQSPNHQNLPMQEVDELPKKEIVIIGDEDKENIPPNIQIVRVPKTKIVIKGNKRVMKKKLAFLGPQQPKITKFFSK